MFYSMKILASLCNVSQRIKVIKDNLVQSIYAQRSLYRKPTRVPACHFIVRGNSRQTFSFFFIKKLDRTFLSFLISL